MQWEGKLGDCGWGPESKGEKTMGGQHCRGLCQIIAESP